MVGGANKLAEKLRKDAEAAVAQELQRLQEEQDARQSDALAEHDARRAWRREQEARDCARARAGDQDLKARDQVFKADDKCDEVAKQVRKIMLGLQRALRSFAGWLRLPH